MITTEDEYNHAYDEAVSLAMRDPEPDTADGQRLLALVADLESYEKRTWPGLGEVSPEMAGKPLC